MDPGRVDIGLVNDVQIGLGEPVGPVGPIGPGQRVGFERRDFATCRRLERDEMLVGNPNARMVYYDQSGSTFGMLPADFDCVPLSFEDVLRCSSSSDSTR